MAQERVQPIRRFQAMDEAGQSYHIVGSQRVVLPAEGGKGEPVSISLRTIEGFPVRRLRKGEYEVEVKSPSGGTKTIRLHTPAADAP